MAVFLPYRAAASLHPEASRGWTLLTCPSVCVLFLLLPPSSYLRPIRDKAGAISTSIMLTPCVTCVANPCPSIPPQKQQVCSMRLFVCSLPALHRAALSYSQQVAHLAAREQRLDVLRHTSCFKWRFWSEANKGTRWCTYWVFKYFLECAVWKKCHRPHCFLSFLS